MKIVIDVTPDAQGRIPCIACEGGTRPVFHLVLSAAPGGGYEPQLVSCAMCNGTGRWPTRRYTPDEWGEEMP